MISEKDSQTILTIDESRDVFNNPESKNEGTYKQLREIGARAEEAFGRPIVIIHNQVEYVDGYKGRTFRLFVISSEETAEYDNEILSFLYKQGENYFLKNIPDFYLTFGVLDYKKWIENFSDNILSEARGLTKFGPYLWASVVYGQKYMSLIKDEVKKAFGDDIIERMRAERKRWKGKIRRDEIKRYKERKKQADKLVLNETEQDQIKRFLKDAEQTYLDGRRVFVGADGSGRPVAKAIGWYLEEKVCQDCEIFFVDPHQLIAFSDDEELEEEKFAKFASSLEQENPSLYQYLVKNPELVCYVDDQIGNEYSSKIFFRFCNFLCNKKLDEQANVGFITLLKEFKNDNPPPSWWKRRDVQGIELVPQNHFSLTSKESPTKESEDFYRRLKQLAEEFAQTNR